MGLGTLPDRADGQIINDTWYNVVKTALTVDFLSRDISGVVTDAAGNLGSLTYAWADAFLQRLRLRANGHLVNLIPPGGLAADYTLTLPVALPAQNVRLAVDNTGAMFMSGAFQTSASSGAFVSASASYADVTNLSVTITSGGRPIMVMLIPDGSGNQSYVASAASGNGATAQFLCQILRGATVLSQLIPQISTSGASDSNCKFPPGVISFLDPVAAGTYTYKLQAKDGVTHSLVNYCQLIAFEI